MQWELAYTHVYTYTCLVSIKIHLADFLAPFYFTLFTLLLFTFVILLLHSELLLQKDGVLFLLVKLQFYPHCYCLSSCVLKFLNKLQTVLGDKKDNWYAFLCVLRLLILELCLYAGIVYRGKKWLLKNNFVVSIWRKKFVVSRNKHIGLIIAFMLHDKIL